jgi:hypothetical protein
MAFGGLPVFFFVLFSASISTRFLIFFFPLSTTGSKGEPCFWPFGQFLFDKNTARL